jgi:hypothetical protein
MTHSARLTPRSAGGNAARTLPGRDQDRAIGAMYLALGESERLRDANSFT